MYIYRATQLHPGAPGLSFIAVQDLCYGIIVDSTRTGVAFPATDTVGTGELVSYEVSMGFHEKPRLCSAPPRIPVVD